MRTLAPWVLISETMGVQRALHGLTGAAALAICLAGTAAAQDLLTGPNGAPLLFPGDVAVLDSPENRKEINCTVTPVKPQLGFDMKFHAGYEVAIPLKDISGTGNELRMLFRVAPEEKQDAPVFFEQRISVPEIAEDARGDANLNGEFDLGEGKYHVSWLMRDRGERVCSSNWDAEANLPAKDRQMALDIPAQAIKATEKERFKREAPVARDTHEGGLKVKVMVNFAPQNAASSALQPSDMEALISILRNIAREPKIGRFSLVVFNVLEQRVIYRQEDATQIDFPALGDAVKTLTPGTIDLKVLSQKHADGEFLTSLMAKEIAASPEPPDAVIIAGPKVKADDSVAPETIRLVSETHAPVFYMNFNLDPIGNPWRDAIGSAVRTLKGVEYTITRPRDLFFAWSEIVGRIVKSKLGRTVAGNAASQ